MVVGIVLVIGDEVVIGIVVITGEDGGVGT